MSRLLVLVSHSLHVRNFLSSGCLEALTARGHRITLLLPGSLMAEVADLSRVAERVLPMEPYLGGRARAFIRSFFPLASFVQRRGFTTYRYKLELDRPWWPRLQIALCRALERRWDLEALARRIDVSLPPRPAALALAREVRSDLFFYPTLIWDGAELELLKAARLLGVPAVAFAASWDTLTSKGFFLLPPDYLLVWGDDNLRQAVEHHAIPPERISVTGAPHLDVYARGARAEERQAFLSRRGIPPSSRVILFAGTTVSYMADEPIQLRALSDLIVQGQLEKCVIWYRPHPRRAYRDVSDLLNLPGVYVDDQVLRQKARGASSYSTAPEDVWHYRSLLDACDGVVTAFSTMIIEAALLGKPSLVVGFSLKDDERSRLRHRSEFDHMREVIRFPGVTLCESLDEVVAGIRRILAGDFESMADVLQRRASRIARNLDGRARERIILALEEILSRGTLT